MISFSKYVSHHKSVLMLWTITKVVVLFSLSVRAYSSIVNISKSFINLRRWEDLRRFTFEYITMFRIIHSPADRTEIETWSSLQNNSKKNIGFPELITFLIGKHITIVRRVLKTFFVVNYVWKHPVMLERPPSEKRPTLWIDF